MLLSGTENFELTLNLLKCYNSKKLWSITMKNPWELEQLVKEMLPVYLKHQTENQQPTSTLVQEYLQDYKPRQVAALLKPQKISG
jgi:hypothetical protein